MLDLGDMVDAQHEGLAKVQSLPPEEAEAFRELIAVMAEQVVSVAYDKKANYDLTVTNSMRFGIACGLELKVENGQLKRRIDGENSSTYSERGGPGKSL